jgi:nicotinamidase-related amidase
MKPEQLIEKSGPFLTYISDWVEQLKPIPLSTVVVNPSRTAIVSIDVINGFCHEGPLASPRVRNIVGPIVALFRKAHAAGVRQMVLIQEAHEPDALEFAAYPPHGIRGTAESDTVPEIKALPFFHEMTVITKNSIHPALGTTFEAWLAEHPQVDTFIAVGDCTDLCTYQLAMHLRLRANADQLRQRVVVPAACVDTYDLPVSVAQQIGAIPHDGDVLHHLFLYHMGLNGIEVVKHLE